MSLSQRQHLAVHVQGIVRGIRAGERRRKESRSDRTTALVDLYVRIEDGDGGDGPLERLRTEPDGLDSSRLERRADVWTHAHFVVVGVEQIGVDAQPQIQPVVEVHLATELGPYHQLAGVDRMSADAIDGERDPAA